MEIHVISFLQGVHTAHIYALYKRCNSHCVHVRLSVPPLSYRRKRITQSSLSVLQDSNCCHIKSNRPYAKNSTVKALNNRGSIKIAIFSIEVTVSVLRNGASYRTKITTNRKSQMFWLRLTGIESSGRWAGSIARTYHAQIWMKTDSQYQRQITSSRGTSWRYDVSVDTPKVRRRSITCE